MSAAWSCLVDLVLTSFHRCWMVTLDARPSVHSNLCGGRILIGAHMFLILSQQLIIRRSFSSDCFLPALPLFCHYHHDHFILKPLLSLSLSLSLSTTLLLLLAVYLIYIALLDICNIILFVMIAGRSCAVRLVRSQSLSVNSTLSICRLFVGGGLFVVCSL